MDNLRNVQKGDYGRQKVILCLTDEDLTDVGIEPSTIPDELFDAIADELAEYFNESWQHALLQSVESAQLTSPPHK